MTLAEFLASKYRNIWLELDDMRVYVRKSWRHLDGNTRRCIDVASVEVDEYCRGQGIFTKWLAELEQIIVPDYEYVFVECVLNEKLVPHLEKLGYSAIRSTITPDLYKSVNKLELK